jgi:GT2 family glycosyltransferase
MYWEDTDLSERLRRAGWQLSVFEEGHVRHYGGASGGGLDSCRRPDLYAWWLYGRQAWFARHRPLWESTALWLLDAVDVFRKLVRGVVRRRVRREWHEAMIVATILARRLIGSAPPLPGNINRSPLSHTKGTCHAAKV